MAVNTHLLHYNCWIRLNCLGLSVIPGGVQVSLCTNMLVRRQMELVSGSACFAIFVLLFKGLTLDFLLPALHTLFFISTNFSSEFTLHYYKFAFLPQQNIVSNISTLFSKADFFISAFAMVCGKCGKLVTIPNSLLQ